MANLCFICDKELSAESDCQFCLNFLHETMEGKRGLEKL